MVDKNINLFLDSGAFSAFTQGLEIDIQEYIQFIKDHEEFLEVYANLDVIGDPIGTLKNQEIMEEAGLSPLPCFHYGEPIRYLKQYLKKYDYIALGGMAADKSGAALSSQKRAAWLDYIFQEHICDKKGFPTVKVHGFGMTSLPLMLRYPWYSVDSTSWVVTGRMGSVYVPQKKGGVYIYDENSWKVCVSSKSPSKKDKGKHIDSFSPTAKRFMLDYFEDKGFVLGKSSFKKEPLDYELKENEKWSQSKKECKEKNLREREVEVIEQNGVCNDYKLRDELNVIYFLDLEKSMPQWPWAMNLNNRSAGFSL